MGFLLLNLALAGSLEFAMAAIWLIYHAVNYLLSAIFRNLRRIYKWAWRGIEDWHSVICMQLSDCRYVLVQKLSIWLFWKLNACETPLLSASYLKHHYYLLQFWKQGRCICCVHLITRYIMQLCHSCFIYYLFYSSCVSVVKTEASFRMQDSQNIGIGKTQD